MKTKIFLVIAFFMVSGFIFSQENQKTTKDKYAYKNAIDVAYEASFPTGDLADGADTSWAGFTARYEFNIGKGWDGMITSGYLSFVDKNNQSYDAIPLMIGAKYHFVDGWYGMAETGYHFFSTSGLTKYSDPSEWGFSVGTGYEIPLSDLLSIDISTKYQYNVDDLSYWNTRAGLMFKF